MKSMVYKTRHRGPAFTLVELLVVMVIITVLLGAVLVAGTTLITRSKIRSTQAVLSIVRDAVDEFAREQKGNPTLTRQSRGVIDYTDRFGLFPPDELEWLQGVKRGNVEPPIDTFAPMLFYVDDPTAPLAAMEHRDLAAMILAIELFGDQSRDLLDGLAERNRTAGAVDGNGVPSQFLDRNQNGSFDPDDLQIRYIVDDWGTPIGYFAQRDFNPANPPPTVSVNHPNWNQVSTKLVRLNGKQPVLFSYGKDGDDQLTREAMTVPAPQSPASIVGDYMNPAAPDVLDNPYNLDNVYLDSTFQTKLLERPEEP